MTTIKKLLQQNIDSLDVEILLAFVLKKDRAFLFANPDHKLTKKQEIKFKKLIGRRKQGWPVAYLTGEKEFFGLKFYVNKDVLIPRPETETLVELVLSQISNLKSPISILDIGTGSGCIIISLAKTLHALRFTLFASDISIKALAVAKKNARRHNVKIQFKQGSLLEPWKGQKFDVIVANLPYLAELTHASTKFEPKQALVAKKHGLALIEELFKQASHLRGVRSSDRTTKQSNPLAIFVEFDPRQTTQIKNLAKKYLPGFKTKIFKDLSGNSRVALLSNNGPKPF